MILNLHALTPTFSVVGRRCVAALKLGRSRSSALPLSRAKWRSAFTLLELLVVITIIGILATIALPAIKGMTKSNSIAAGDRQLLDDIGLARQLAIANHTTVYMVFIPPYIINQTLFPTNTMTGAQQTIITNLYIGQYTTYAMLSLRTVGDQPGASTPRYWTEWRTLPGGVYIATNKFVTNTTTPLLAPMFDVGDVAFPFPVATNAFPNTNLPYIAFDYRGQPVHGFGANQTTGVLPPEYIPLVHGSIFYNDAGSGPVADVAEAHVGDAYYPFNINNVSEMQTNGPLDTGNYYNQIYVDPLTGRPRVQKLDVQ